MNSDDIATKVCRCCKQRKLEGHFTPKRSMCKECRKQEERVRRSKDPESYRAACRKWRAANTDKHTECTNDWKRRTGYYKTERAREYFRERQRMLRDTVPGYKLEQAFRGGVWRGLKLGGKKSKTFDALGYTKEQLMDHLEGLFSEGMNWGNYGDWHVDHIKPLSCFRYETTDDPEFAQAWALSNLQPLWAMDNYAKSNKIAYVKTNLIERDLAL